MILADAKVCLFRVNQNSVRKIVLYTTHTKYEVRLLSLFQVREKVQFYERICRNKFFWRVIKMRARLDESIFFLVLTFEYCNEFIIQYQD